MTIKEAIKKARQNFEWTDMPAGEPSSVDIGFLRSDGREDETQFDLYSDDMEKELDDLWDEMCYELESGKRDVLYVSLLGYIEE